MANETKSLSRLPVPKSRRTVIPEEDATKLQFGEFADGDALTPTDVATLLVAARSRPGVPPAPDNKVYKSTQEYATQFSNAQQGTIDSTRQSLHTEDGFLNKFEIAQILYLRPEKVEVAVALIPSLERYAHGEDEEMRLQSILEDVRAAVRRA